MVSLTKDRNTPQIAGDLRTGPVAAGEHIFAGAMVMRNAAGALVRGQTAAGLVGVGRAEVRAGNIGDAEGIVLLPYAPGRFRFANAPSDPIGTLHVDAVCYAIDDQTVAATDGGGTRSPAGIVDMIDASGVWVLFDEALTRAAAGAVPPPAEQTFQPLAGYLDAPNVTVLGASHASGSFGIRTGINDTLAARFARRGWTGTLRSFAQGGSNIAGARQQWQDALALPEVAAAVGRNVWIIDSGGNDIGAHLPYPNRADFVRTSLRALVADIQATGDKVIFLPQTKRYAPWSGLTEASNLETDGILPYNLGIFHPLISELTPDWADEDGRAYVDPYKLADAYRAIVGQDGNHGYGQNLADFVLGKATNRIKALDPAAPRQGSIIWGARTTTQAYAYGNRNELNPAQGGPDIVEANNLARFNYMVGAGKTDGGVDDFVTFKMGPFGGRAGGPGIGGAGRVTDPLMATAETLGSGWYVQDLNAGFVEVHGLVPGSQVQVSFVAASTSSTGRTGRYTLTGGEQVTVDATTVSPSNYHKFAPIAVPADGKVRLDFVSATGAGGFALLNALRLDYL